jgi:hypothetical protein
VLLGHSERERARVHQPLRGANHLQSPEMAHVVCWGVTVLYLDVVGSCHGVSHSCTRCTLCPDRPDAKSAYYHDTIKKGDLLLSRIQKLSKIIDME